MERFAGLNICGLSSIKFFAVIFHGALATSVHYLCIAKNSQEYFRGKLKNRENHESLAQRIFSRLRYYIIILLFYCYMYACFDEVWWFDLSLVDIEIAL